MDKSNYLHCDITTSMSKDQLWEMFLNGDIKIKTRNTVKAVLDGSEYAEFLKCKNDIAYFAENYFHIVDLDVGQVKMKLYDWQKIELANWENNSHSNTLHARQIGGTTIQALFALHQALFSNNNNIAILFNRDTMAKEFLHRLKTAIQKIPNFLKQGVLSYSRDNVSFPNGSKIFCKVLYVDALHSQSVNTLIFDNPDYMDSSRFDEFFHSYIPVMSSMINSRIIFCGTPLLYDISRQKTFATRGFNTTYYPWYVLPHHTEKYKTQMLNYLNNDTSKWNAEFELKHI